MRGEVETLREKGVVEAKAGFPGARSLVYRAESSPAVVAPTAFLSGNEIVVRLPEAVVLAWATSAQVSIAGDQVLDNGDLLKVLVEKDFACLTEREDEDESDMFPHPGAGKESR